MRNAVLTLRIRKQQLQSTLLLIICVVAGSVTADNYKVPRNDNGQPDLQGFWTNATLTPLERETKYGDRLVLTAQEVADLEGENASFRDEQNQPTDPSLTVEDLPKDCGGGFTGVNCGYNNFWVDPGNHIMVVDGEPRNSIITFPKNGRVPGLTKEAQQRRMQLYARYRNGAVEGPEVRALGERCLMSFGSSAGPPMIPLLYNNNYQIVQNKEYVMILVEMVHDARIIRLDGKHQPATMDKWMGDSVGHYQGNTLVVETTNMRPEQSFQGAGANIKIVEKFTRVADDKIKYEFTIDDPDSFTEKWGGEIAMNQSHKPLYEYACHEGNYALTGILAGARRQEREAARQ